MQRFHLGRFEIVREIGRGAMGRVYLAHDPRLDRSVAIKALEIVGSMPAAEKDETLQRFLREARAAGKLHHPGIVTIYDAGDELDQPYIAMEYIEGVGLDHFTRPPDLLPHEQVIHVGIQACEALDYAHRSGLVHRDVKPANLMLVQGKVLKITDFGLAKHPEASLTSDGTLIGTPNYMSPEQIAGHKLDGRSDLFSLAVVLYELLAGERPFQGETISTVMYRILHDEARDADAVNPSIPRPMAQVLRRALSKDPHQRYANGAEMAAALRAALRKTPPGLSSRIAPSGQRSIVIPPPPEADRRSRATIYGVVGGVAAGGVILAAVFLQYSFNRSGRGPAGAAGTPAAAGQRAPAFSATSGGASPLPGGPAAAAGAAAGGAPSKGARPAEPVKAVRTVRVVTEPPFGQLFLDGVPIDSDLLRLERARGARKLRAVRGCRTAEITVDPAASGDELALKLQPARPVEVPVRSIPAHATVQINGKDTGEKTPTRLRIDPCAGATIALALDGHRSGEVAIPADIDPVAMAPLLASVRLSRLPEGRIVVAARPFQIEVQENGRKIGMAGDEITVPSGHRKFLLVNDDLFLRVPLDVAVQPGRSVRIDAPVPNLGKLSVQAYPSNCRVYVRREGESANRFLDEVPMLDRLLAPGAYLVVVEYSATDQRQEKPVVIEPGRAKTVSFRFAS